MSSTVVPPPIPGIKLPVTALVPVRNEAANIGRCLESLHFAEHVVVVDSRSHDGTPELAASLGAQVVQFDHPGGYPKKRQWALDHLDLTTPWVLLIDADEVVPDDLRDEIRGAVEKEAGPDAYLITKGFHFLGRRFRFGGFSFAAVALFRRGAARFEELVELPDDRLDMEVHERLIVDGPIGRLRTPLIHEDFKGLAAYLDRHNRYSTWEAALREQFLATGRYGRSSITPRLGGNTQERRRWLKRLILRLPGEPWLWFFYHYLVRLGCLEGRPGLIACQFRAAYIRDVRAKLFERRLNASHPS